MAKAYLNALAEEGTRQDHIDWLVRLDEENDRLRHGLRTVLGDADHGQNMTWEERCRVGREALSLKSK